MLKYKLRPHHGLCINFFGGKGYSQEFINNMTAIIEILNHENPEIELTTNHDIICCCCSCTDCRDKALSYDVKVMEICGVSENIRWKDFSKKVYEKIIITKRLKEVCSNCQWFYICKKKGLD